MGFLRIGGEDMTPDSKNNNIALERCDLTVKGMHCAACASRVEGALKRVPGVEEATVNLLAERAAVKYDPQQAKPEDLIEALDIAGYDGHVAHLDPFSADTSTQASQERRTEMQELLLRFGVSLALTIPVLIMGMGPHIGLIPMHWSEQSWWNWVQLILTTPVLLWAGAGFFRGAWAALRQRASDMNTLIAVGTFAAYTYSLAVTVAPDFFASHG